MRPTPALNSPIRDRVTKKKMMPIASGASRDSRHRDDRLQEAGSAQNGVSSAGTAIHNAKTTMKRLSRVKRQFRRAMSILRYVIVNDTEIRVVNPADQAEREKARRQEAEEARKRRTDIWPATGMLSICE